MTEADFMSIGEPAEEETEATEETTETAETAEETENPDGEETEETEETTEEQTEEEGEQPPAPPQIDPDEARRRAEAFRQRMDYDREVRNVLGKVNPYNGQVIQTVEDFEAYRQAHNQAQQRANTSNLFERIQQGTASPEEFDSYVQNIVRQQMSSSPDIQRVKLAADKAERAERQAKLDSGRSRMQADIDALNKEFPDCGIKTVEDIKDTAMIGYLRQGLTVADAYYLTHRKEITAKQQAAAKQAVINQTAGKAHLKTTSGQAAEEMGVTEEMIDAFRPFYPKATRAELVKMCKRYGNL